MTSTYSNTLMFTRFHCDSIFCEKCCVDKYSFDPSSFISAFSLLGKPPFPTKEAYDEMKEKLSSYNIAHKVKAININDSFFYIIIFIIMEFLHNHYRISLSTTIHCVNLFHGRACGFSK